MIALTAAKKNEANYCYVISLSDFMHYLFLRYHIYVSNGTGRYNLICRFNALSNRQIGTAEVGFIYRRGM
jgi:hypothetical protein